MIVETTKQGIIHYVVGDWYPCGDTVGSIFTPKQILDSHKKVLIESGDQGFYAEYNFHFKRSVEAALSYRMSLQNDTGEV